ncbi:hypothetical protein GOBAR_AA38409 [Gossypium barbadense]|uniref:Uncharacterized protein n=1 Tax=Gossypium barbadense TaxID=3634 RepID=A0A2P5VTZ6_GOSBA|nr:hypothetical protein GOBAR_AA38409 [Gossypium barbadense]
MDCERALSEGPWIILGQYLTVQPWMLAFDPSQAYLSVVMAWIRFPGLPGDMDMTLVERRLTQRKCLRKGKIGCERVGEDKRNLWAVDDC